MGKHFYQERRKGNGKRQNTYFLVSYSLVHDSKENEFKWIEQGTLSVMGSIINLRGIVLFPSPHPPPPPWTRTFIFGAPMTEVTWFMCGDVESVMYLNSKGKNGNFWVWLLKRRPSDAHLFLVLVYAFALSLLRATFATLITPLNSFKI